MTLKDSILELRNKGFSYNQIVKALGCAKSTVAYHCSPTIKRGSKERVKKWRKNNKYFIIIRKVDMFRNAGKMRLRAKTSGFSRGSARRISPKPEFTYKDVLDKFGEETKCYLTGLDINMIKDEYHFDHIIPTSKGGENSLDNLGICTKQANLSKSDMTVEEYLNHCKQVLRNFGYNIT